MFSLPIGTVEHLAYIQLDSKPASLLRELIENAIDASSTTIEISLEHAGYSLMKVTDNGSGIKHEYISQLCKHYTTTKLKDLSDMKNLKTIGFHGSSLSHISCIANLKITSRTQEDTQGVTAEYSFSVMTDHKRTSDCQIGTSVEVTDLLFSHPEVRAQYDVDQEMSRAITIVAKYAVAYPDIDFDVFCDGERCLKTDKVTDACKRLGYFIDEGARVGHFRIEDEGIAIDVVMLVHRPLAQKTLRGVFLNGRLVKSEPLEEEMSKILGNRLHIPANETNYIIKIEFPQEEMNLEDHYISRCVNIPKVIEILARLAPGEVNACAKTAELPNLRHATTVPTPSEPEGPKKVRVTTVSKPPKSITVPTTTTQQPKPTESRDIYNPLNIMTTLSSQQKNSDQEPRSRSHKRIVITK